MLNYGTKVADIHDDVKLVFNLDIFKFIDLDGDGRVQRLFEYL